MGMLFNEIHNEEVEMIETYIDYYATTDEMDAVRTKDAKYLLREWDRAKSQYLSKMFGNKLILSKDVVFKATDDQLRIEMERKLYNHYSDINELLREIGNIQWELRDSDSNIYYGMSSLMSTRTLASNIYDGETFELPIPNSDKTLKISHGAKTIKAIGKIVSAFGLDVNAMEHLRIVHSQVLNQKMLKGKMCLSIHPLDYITMSDNDCGWSSCMSWPEIGCYRQGTVEMMNSPMVVVAYLCASDPMSMPQGHHWTNKKWRELFIVTPEMISNVKAYPYKNSILSTIVLDWLKELATNANIGSYDETVTKWDMDEFFERKGENYRVSPYTNNMYNDFAEDHLAYFGEALDKYAEEVYEVCYSGASECMLCGELNPCFSSEGYVVGQCCDEVFYCDCCGERYRKDDLIELDGEFYCEYCYDNHVCTDDITGETHNYQNLEKIYLTDSDGVIYYENYCIRTERDNIDDPEIMKEYFIGPIFEMHSWYGYRFLVSADQLTDKGLNLFGYENKEDLLNDMITYTGTTLGEDVIKARKKILQEFRDKELAEKLESENKNVLQEAS